MKRYLLVDNDNTLMDFSAAERGAVSETLSDFGLPHDGEACALYTRCNVAAWEALERGEMNVEQVKVRRFEDFLAAVARTDCDAAAICDAYENRLGSHAELLPGAMALLTALQGKMKIALVSNGIPAVQHSRLSLSPFPPLLDAVVISGEIGVSKPDRRVADIAMEMLGCTDPAEAILLGDSLTADIACARNAGIDSIWLAKPGKESPLPTHTVYDLGEATQLLLRLSGSPEQ